MVSHSSTKDRKSSQARAELVNSNQKETGFGKLLESNIKGAQGGGFGWECLLQGQLGESYQDLTFTCAPAVI